MADEAIGTLGRLLWDRVFVNSKICSRDDSDNRFSDIEPKLLVESKRERAGDNDGIDSCSLLFLSALFLNDNDDGARDLLIVSPALILMAQ